MILDSPVIETSQSFKQNPLFSSRSLYLKAPMSMEKTLLSEQNQFPLLSKHNRSHKSYHDLIVESKSKHPPSLPSSSLKSQSALNYFPPKSNLYNLEKINDSLKNNKKRKMKLTCVESEILHQRNKSSLRHEKSPKRYFEKRKL